MRTREGSSPLTRGKRPPAADRRRRLGLIPAHAGKTSRLCSFRSPRPAHPRSRGENCGARVKPRGVGGSSPLTRGKHRNGVLGFGKHGLIPAHAGKTSAQTTQAPVTAAHPRSRGENRGLTRDVAGTEGSSPLTRGKRSTTYRSGQPNRLIPAHAGKTKPWTSTPPPKRAHPRSRGENPSRGSRSTLLPGSSPLTRGKPAAALGTCKTPRLIPAHAGKTSAAWT